MFRVLVLIGAFLFFRAGMPRKAKWSTTAITPYMNALDGTLSAQQVSSVLNETVPYESWLASHRAKAGTAEPANTALYNPEGAREYSTCSGQNGQREVQHK